MRGLSVSPERPLQQRIGLLAPVAAEVTMQQVHHRPQMASFLDVDLEKVAQIVQRGRRQPEMALLLDRRGLGVALRDDDAAQVGAMLAGHVLPRRLAEMLAEMDLSLARGGSEEDAPPVIGHLDEVEMRPAARVDTDCRAQVDVEIARPPPAPFPPTIGGNSVASARARAATRDPRPGSRCSESSRCS
jgi:hypothetical protein